MDIEVRKEGTTVFITPEEEIHFDNYKELEEQITKEIEEGAMEVVLDLTNVDTLYSMTLGMFNKIAATISEKGGKFSLTNINNDISKLICLINQGRFQNFFIEAGTEVSDIFSDPTRKITHDDIRKISRKYDTELL